VSRLNRAIAELTAHLSQLQREQIISEAAAALTDRALLREPEIVAAATPWGNAAGVYFLICAGAVVYVGQAVNVYKRISEHKDKKFTHFAFVPCAPDSLDVLESLYIHVLRPQLNGNSTIKQEVNAKVAPISLPSLLNLASKGARK
jgi:hypothetical protein